MVADCFHYQVDIVGGDDNSSIYRFGGSNQKSSSNEQSLFQEVFRSFRDSLVSRQGGDLAVRPKLRFTSGNTTETLRYFEENFGRPWNDMEVKLISISFQGRRKFVPCPVRQERLRNRKARQEAN